MKKVVNSIADRSRAKRKPAPAVVDTAPVAVSWPERLHAVLRDVPIDQVAYVFEEA
ncbi:MAG: hypothetical protein ACXWIT_25525 [Burkholderiales bacterium]